jgi:beta-lactamase superfamily II metal-dependent hydrolase
MCFAVAFCALAVASATAGLKDGRLDIYWVDTEGGAATLIVTPAGEAILIDTGNPGRRDADRITQVVTKEAGLARIDHLITTHYHGDHFGGASFLAKNLPIGTLYDNGEFEGQVERPSKDYLALQCEKRVVINPGDSLPLKQAGEGAKLSLQCIGTRQKFIAPMEGAADNTSPCAALKTKDRDGSDNANSVVSLVAFGTWKFFDAGDLTWNREAELVCPKNLVGKVDVYQVTHHGLDSSNNPVVLQSLEPTVAVMNNGHTKGCMPEVFENLTATKSIQAIYQVHKNLRPDGEKSNTIAELIANAQEPQDCQGHFIKLSVARDGKSYTVSIPAHKHEREFRTRD